MTRADNDWAFPHTIEGNQGPITYQGMTLRDYFAGKELSKIHGTSICDAPESYARVADHCYRMADAMLAERAKP